MKKRSKILIGVMSLSLLGAVGSALALTRNSATASSTSPSFDSAIYLYWDHEASTSATISDIPSISVNSPVYRYLTVSPKSSKSVAVTVTVSFALAALTDCVITGLTVDVFETASLANDSTVAGLINGVSATPALSPSNLSGNATFSVSSSASAHETQKFYAIRVNYDGTAAPGATLGGLVTITQSFTPAA